MCKNEAIAFLVAYSYHFFPIKCERRKAKACNSRSIASVWLFIAFNNKKLVQLTPKFWNHWLSVKQKQSDLFRQFFRKKARIFAITCVPRAKWSSLVSVTNENSIGIGLWTPENIVYWLLFSYLSLACVFWIVKKDIHCKYTCYTTASERIKKQGSILNLLLIPCSRRWVNTEKKYRKS